jgi:hypothetical protein
MFPFKVQLFQGCKSETEPINTKYVVQHVIRYQVLLAAYYKANTKYCYCRATCWSGHNVDFTTHINRLYMIRSIVGGILQSWYQVLLLSCNMFVRSHFWLHYTHQPFAYDTKYCWRHITKPIPSIVTVVQHVCQVTLLTSHINRLYMIRSIIGGILQSVLNLAYVTLGAASCIQNSLSRFNKVMGK